jgi:aldose sugar dehydrogenase
MIRTTHRAIRHAAMRIPLSLAVSVGLLVSFAPGLVRAVADAEVTTSSAPARPALTELPSLQAANIRGARLEALLEGLDEPWALEFLAQDEVLITERRGRLLRYRFGDAAPRAVAGVPEVASTHAQAGLLDVALHPRFAENGRIYFSFVRSDPQAPTYTLTALATAILDGEALREVKVLLEAGPYGWAPSIFGGAIAFDDRGYLYLSIGDRSEHHASQRGDRLQGKILRLADDGSVPADNPFVGVEGMDERIYALGVRNAQGLYFDAQRGLLFEAEHGPMGGDEVNIIRAGANYGWPTVTYGKDYTGAELGMGTHAPGMVQPLWYFTPSIAVSPLLVYRGAMFPEWEGDLLLGALRGQHVVRLDLDGVTVRTAQTLLTEIDARVRDLKVDAAGALYILIQPGKLLRLARETEPAEPQPQPQPQHAAPEAVYQLICAGCHASGAYQAPNPDKPEQWSRILAEPAQTSYRRTIDGHGAMPERGLCHQCSDEILRNVVDWMRERAAGAEPRP